jgi:pyridoxal phosphate enzyme (YggS family)
LTTPSEPAPDTAAARLAAIRQSMAVAEKRFGRIGSGPELVAVSKTVAAEALVPFLDAGQRLFGENRVQEAAAKWPGLRAHYDGIQLHLIGPLQSNKVKEAVTLFDVIETVDREKLAVALAAEQLRSGRSLRYFVQVNIGREDQKAGVDPTEAVAFSERCRAVHGLAVTGLMCIPPAGLPAGPYFAHMVTLARDAGLADLSMGMSADFELAIAMGATHIRVGTALFGARVQVRKD